MRASALRYLSLTVLPLLAAIRPGAAPAQVGSSDTSLVRAIQEQVAAREHYRVATERVHFADEASQVIPGLRYRWADYRLWDDAATLRYHAVMVSGALGARVVRTAAEWSTVVGPWYPTDAADAKHACLEVFRAVRTDAGPGPDRYVLYEPPGNPLPGMDPAGARHLRRNMDDTSRVRAFSSPARWDVKMWVVSGYWNGTGHRIHCTLPRTSSDPRVPFDVQIVRTVQAPPNRLLM
jgi:hypothetical protein